MEETLKKIRDRHKQEIEDFQNNCVHPYISGWMEYYWAPGHLSGYVKICEICEKIISENYSGAQIRITP